MERVRIFLDQCRGTFEKVDNPRWLEVEKMFWELVELLHDERVTNRRLRGELKALEEKCTLGVMKKP